jgi:predicted metal-dependent phosphoesterase TrpH
MLWRHSTGVYAPVPRGEPVLELTDGLQASVVDMHLHTLGTSSDSMLDPLELPEVAVEAGLTGCNLAEHDQVWERHRQVGYRADNAHLFINFGIEVSTEYGHMLAIGLREYVGGIRRADRLREELDKVGGFLIVAHPFRHVFDPVTAMRKGGAPFNLTPEEAAEMPVFKIVDAIEIANAANTPRENYFAAEVAKYAQLPTTGGSDAHSKSGVGYYATGFEEAIRDEAHFLELLHAGRMEAVHRTPAGRFVRFEQGSIEAAQEETAPIDS